jgi:hypothetical protein
MRLVACLLLLGGAAAADCFSIEEASKQVGESICVTGKVANVNRGPSGTHFINFCSDYMTCPFAVVVFPDDLRQVGDVRQLVGQSIEVHGTVQLYKSRAEIVLRHSRQLRGASPKLPPVPKEYDAERHGRYSAGRFKRPKRTPDKPADPLPTNPSEPSKEPH